MRSIPALSLTVLLCLIISGCQTESNRSPAPIVMGNNQSAIPGQTPAGYPTPAATSGTTASAATSGNTTVSTANGNIGGSVGQSMDAVDQMKLNQTLETSRTNQSNSWSNPGNGTTFTVTPTRTFSSPTGQPCRDFSTSAVVKSQNQTIYGTACRDNNGQWHIVSS